MDSVGKMQEEALKRKERLKALKEKKEADNSESKLEGEQLPKPVFRSYKPKDESLQESKLPQVKPSDVTDKIKSHLEAATEEMSIEEVDLINLAPRKPDWDLKRDVAKKLEKLERRTQRAIAELIRERLQASNEDLALAVNAAAVDSRNDDDDDED
ncbi:coiled-coil domain-containing protein 12-like [Crassostrea angulata]|uniref:Coiled-coil domain-containing protein 12 n=1 Tax=Magallana gigas TaxID=29159 RepID=K1PM00_MAGGI|nr:coiled-coil domain-containing protein 12-like [Crassostrea angulata]|eukprot:XP_011418659.1 PREDICTED: coiled-coil domain-containing protein 12 [Crassostrea gigas]